MAARLQGAAAMRALAHPTRIALMEVLRVHDTLTATEASALIGQTPTNCAFHLRALSRFGFVEEVGTGPGRRRPWRALDVPLAFSDVQDDEQSRAAARALSDVLVRHWLERVQSAQASRYAEPAEWQDVLGGSGTVVYGTVDEVREMVTDIRAVLSRYDDRLRDASARPEGSRSVELLVFAQRYATSES
ncbi:transcriptional regulator [Asanoa ishikariensis]|uniref:Transcriptional regulator, ArsR family n=1 Tax=Asanoa ishikariensis TaxID=137265 RepID=A0A1H3MPM9_9ACTN|nr:helix-turn-helix domain-containing protein [Asanoa ishikariensis]GIF66260.1 transcriptional regulator [Asanoa ishikariensis]SDY78444.1 transcriptional regulator, ArsR family [Asanoa ishikariensis]